MIRIIIGDALAELARLPAESVHCCVTSPPYYGLRDYGVVGQMGLEASPDEYVAAMVGVFRGVRRVLRSDGTLWLNMGDSYASGGRKTRDPDGIKPKDLIGIPWMLAFALRADGWWLRQDIIWSKPNPMPESVTDRCTKAHEYLFLLTKSPKYYYDAGAIQEKATCDRKRGSGPKVKPRTGRNDTATMGGEVTELRNRRSVWTIIPKPFRDAHFATFPPALVEPCILAGTSAKGVCPACGAPWVRQVERVDQGYDGSRYGESAVAATGGAVSGGTARSTLGSSNGKLTGKSVTSGWAPSCGCDVFPLVPATVLDPFIGAGTTALVAGRLGRSAIGIELNPEYVAMAERRIDPLKGALNGMKVALERNAAAWEALAAGWPL